MVQTRVSAEVKDKVDKKLKLTNVLQITWELPDQVHVPAVVPSSFHESMAYLTGMQLISPLLLSVVYPLSTVTLQGGDTSS